VKKDIKRPKVENVAMAIVKEDNEEWSVYLINQKNVTLTNVMVVSKGYGTVNGEEVKTSQLRHFIEEVPANTGAKVEKVVDEVFGLTNEYMLSFYIDSVIYDKKYIFLAESVIEENLVAIPLLEKPGVLIR
jgi:hypothetical protein